MAYLKKNVPRLSFFNSLHIDLYNRCIRPIDQSFDWPSFFAWAKIKGVENIEISADYLIFMRSELNKDTDNIRKVENKEFEKPKKESEFEKKLKNKYSEKKKNKEILSNDDINTKLKKSGKYFQ